MMAFVIEGWLSEPSMMPVEFTLVRMMPPSTTDTL